MKWSSAMRPIVMYRDGKRELMRGTRMSLGGETKSKPFEMHEMDIQEGDTFYLFSDGYPDQFGGPNRKKMKISGLYNILDGLHGMSMEDQGVQVKKEIMDWKGDNSQTDDILIMGIKV